MKNKNAFALAIIFILIILFSPTSIWAGFGVSPGHISNERLYPGASFETKFILSRGNPIETSMAQISVGPSEIEDWFSFSPSQQVLLPEGEQRVPVFVRIDVPKDAEHKDYKGYMNIRVVPEGEKDPGMSIVLGVKLDIDLKVTEVKIIDFVIRKPKINNSEQGFNWWKIKLPATVKGSINVENIGNVKAAPDRVEIEVWDLNEKTLMAQGVDKSLEPIEPFEKKDIEMSFRLDLKPGEYWALVKVFKDENKLLRQEKLHFKITPFEMSTKDWISIVSKALIVVVVVIIAILKRRNIVQILKSPIQGDKKGLKPKKVVLKRTRKRKRTKP